MSKQFLVDFFPDAVRFLDQNYPAVLASLFPPHDVATCLQPVEQVRLPLTHLTSATEEARQVVHVAYYSLIKFKLAGALVGFGGAATLPASCWLWKLAFLFFALMNLDAVIAHNFSIPGTPVRALARTLDIALTACSSACLLLACVMPPGRPTRATRLVVYLLLAAILKFAFQAQYKGIPWASEALYIGTSAAAAVALLRNLVLARWANIDRRRKLWLALACTGLAVASSGLSLDKHLCRIFGSQLTHVHLLVAGCDLIFLGLLGFLVADTRAIPGTAFRTPSETAVGYPTNGSIAGAARESGSAVAYADVRRRRTLDYLE